MEAGRTSGGKPRAARARARRRLLFLVGGLVVVVVGVAVVNQRVSGPGISKVYAAASERRTIRAMVSGPGRVVPEKRVKISSGVMGRIVRLAVREGQWVNAGDLLVQVDSTQYAARVREAEASLEAAESHVLVQESRLARLDRELERNRQLEASRMVSTKELEVVETDAKMARAELNAARHRVSEGSARLASARDDLAKTTIVAPLSGVISELNIEEGEIAIVGTMNYPGTVLMTISDLSQMQVEAEIDETDVLDVALGQVADVYVDALADSALEGRVTDISSSAHTVGQGTLEEATNFAVKVRIEDGGSSLRPGMTANVEIETAVREDALCIPIQAVVKRRPALATEQDNAEGKREKGEEREGVFVIEDGEAVFRPIQTGISDETDIEVISGLEVGQRVVTGPYKVLARIEDGSRVRVTEEGKPDGAD